MFELNFMNMTYTLTDIVFINFIRIIKLMYIEAGVIRGLLSHIFGVKL